MRACAGTWERTGGGQWGWEGDLGNILDSKEFKLNKKRSTVLFYCSFSGCITLIANYF